MNVLSIQSNNYYQPKCNVRFGEGARVSATRCAKELATHYTVFDRQSFNMKEFGDYIYKLARREKEKIKIVFCGCSDGTEVFDIKMSLLDRFRSDKHLMPEILAFDTDKEVIDIAKSGRINISDRGVNYIQSMYPNKRYISDRQEANISDAERARFKKLTGQDLKYSYKISDVVRSNIEFKNSDMLTELNKLDKDACTILFIRNVGRYNPLEEQKLAGELINKNLKQDSLVVLGVCDVHDPGDKVIHGDLSNLPPIPMVGKIYEGKFFPMYDISDEGTFLRKYGK